MIPQTEFNQLLAGLRAEATSFRLHKQLSKAEMCDLAVDLLEELTTPIQKDELQPWMRDDPDAQQRIVNQMRLNERQMSDMRTRFSERARDAIGLDNENRELKRQLDELWGYIQGLGADANNVTLEVMKMERKWGREPRSS